MLYSLDQVVGEQKAELEPRYYHLKEKMISNLIEASGVFIEKEVDERLEQKLGFPPQWEFSLVDPREAASALDALFEKFDGKDKEMIQKMIVSKDPDWYVVLSHGDDQLLVSAIMQYTVEKMTDKEVVTMDGLLLGQLNQPQFRGNVRYTDEYVKGLISFLRKKENSSRIKSWGLFLCAAEFDVSQYNAELDIQFVQPWLEGNVNINAVRLRPPYHKRFQGKVAKRPVSPTELLEAVKKKNLAI